MGGHSGRVVCWGRGSSGGGELNTLPLSCFSLILKDSSPQPGQPLGPGQSCDGAAALCPLWEGKTSQNTAAMSGDQ